MSSAHRPPYFTCQVLFLSLQCLFNSTRCPRCSILLILLFWFYCWCLLLHQPHSLPRDSERLQNKEMQISSPLHRHSRIFTGKWNWAFQSRVYIPKWLICNPTSFILVKLELCSHISITGLAGLLQSFFSHKQTSEWRKPPPSFLFPEGENLPLLLQKLNQAVNQSINARHTQQNNTHLVLPMSFPAWGLQLSFKMNPLGWVPWEKNSPWLDPSSPKPHTICRIKSLLITDPWISSDPWFFGRKCFPKSFQELRKTQPFSCLWPRNPSRNI